MNRRTMAISLGVAIVLGLCSSGGSRAAVAETPAQIVAKQILEATGVHGGLVIHLGCGAGQLTAALRTSDNVVVQGLDASPANVEKARAAIQSSGLYGPVSVNLFDGKRLPYVDNLANLVVVEDPGQVPMAEVMRVLAPLGVACVGHRGEAVVGGGAWAKTVKPWPADIDQWPQHLYGGDNNAVAHDRVVGPPRRYQWTSTPEWSRAHLVLPSIQGLVSARGRLFTVEDQASIEHPALPGEFTLVARDAFNGIVLWQRRFPDWHPMNLYIKDLTAQIMRRLAAIGDTVYCTPGYSDPITVFDAATGKQLKVYEGTERTQELVYDQGVLFAVLGDHVDTRGIGNTRGSLASSQFPQAAYGPIIPRLDDPKSTIVALDAGSGRRLWEKSGADTAGYQGSTLAVRGRYVAFCSARPGPDVNVAASTGDTNTVKRGTQGSVVCLDRTSGAVVWRKPVQLALSSVTGTVPALVLSDSAVYVADAKALHALSIKDGAQLWTGNAAMNHHKAPDLFLTGGVVWSGYGGKYTAYDPATGKVVKTIDQAMTGPMGHDRCYRNRITDRFYIDSATGGSDFVKLDTSGGTPQSEFPHPWARSTCGIGFLPCNGLLYAGPPACSCSNGVMLNALNALAPEPGLKASNQPIEIATIPRLEKGPAYKEIADSKSHTPDSSDWPTYRHDAARSGHTTAAGPAQLEPLWTAKLCTSTGSHRGGVREGVKISAPVIAAGKVFVADVDAHAVLALDADTGRVAWRYTTGARVDSPPTHYQGWLFFGSRDGWVYCLRAADGALAWRFKDLPDDRWIMAYDQPESAWPVSGSVLTLNGVVYFAAGRNSFLDGGIWIYGLDPDTGRVIHRRRMYGPYGDDGFPIIKGANYIGNGIQGFKNDVLLTDGKYLYLRHQPFNLDLSPLPENQSPPPHLIANPGFLESIPQHRSFWTINSALLYDIQTGTTPVHGDILAMDGNKYYEVRGYTPGRTNNFDPRVKGYTLYAGQFSGTTATASSAAGATAQPAAAPAKGKKARKAAAATGAKKKTKTKNTAAGSPQASERWSDNVPLTGKAIALAGDRLFVAGTPVAFPKDDLAAAYEGRMGGVLWVASADSGKKLAEIKLDAPPSWDGMAVAQGRLFVVLQDGSLRCFAAK